MYISTSNRLICQDSVQCASVLVPELAQAKSVAKAFTLIPNGNTDEKLAPVTRVLQNAQN